MLLAVFMLISAISVMFTVQVFADDSEETTTGSADSDNTEETTTGTTAEGGDAVVIPESTDYINQLYATPDEKILPATLCPEIMIDLLRGELGFNGMVVTDASHMVGMTDRMKRKDMLPASINAGCDMFLFFNDPDEDYGTMLNAYKTGIISEARMTEALTRILGLKAHMGLNKKASEERTPAAEALADVRFDDVRAIVLST